MNVKPIQKTVASLSNIANMPHFRQSNIQEFGKKWSMTRIMRGKYTPLTDNKN
jgi:hypothetical protein